MDAVHRFRLSVKTRRLVFTLASTWAAMILVWLGQLLLPGPFLRLEGILTDFRHDLWRHFAGPDPDSPSSGAIVVDIDERTLRELGTYGESYRIHQAKVLSFLERHGAGAVALDVLFKTDDDPRVRVETLLEDLRQSGLDVSGDSILGEKLRSRWQGSAAIAKVLSASDRIVLSSQLSHPQEYANRSDWIQRANKAWQDSVWPGLRLGGKELGSLSGRAAMDNLSPALARARGVIGLANIEPDPDGTVRRISLLWRYPDTPLVDSMLGPSGSAIPRAYPSLALRSIMVLTGRGERELTYKGGILDLGVPLRIWKDSLGVRTSIPELTGAMCRALATHRQGIDSLRNSKAGRIEPTTQIWLRRDPSGVLSTRLAYPDTLDQTSTLSLSQLPDSLLERPRSFPSDTVLLSDSVALVRGQGVFEVLRLISDTLPPQVAKIDSGTLRELVDGIRPLAASGWTSLAPGRDLRISSWIEIWWNPWKGRLESSLPALEGRTLLELTELPRRTLEDLGAGDTLRLGQPVRIAVDDRAAALIPFQSPSLWDGLAPDRSWIRRVSFVDVLEGRLDPALVPGRLFVIGSAATALSDFVDIPIQRRHPGVCVQAATAMSILRGDALSPVETWKIWLVAFLLSTGLGAASVRLSAWGSLASSAACLVVVFAGSVVLFDRGVWTELLPAMGTIGGSFVSILGARYLLEERQRRFLHASFGTYISPHLIERMVESGKLPSLGGEERDITAFFSDIQGFSSISEILSPTDLVELINEYLSATTRILLDRGGTLDKYIGDAIVAMFGAPVELEDHAKVALSTALGMQEALADLREKWKNEGSRWPQQVHRMRMRIGIHSGRIVTGNMGSDKRMNYTMMGDDVNLAARLESACKHYGVWILTTEATMSLAGGGFLAREIDRVRVVGKTEAVATWEVLGEVDRCPASWKECLEIWSRARGLYLAGNFSDARDLFLQSEQLEPYRDASKTNPSKVFIERCEEFTASPPSEFWDGSHTAKEK